jgi:hypothetical protein
MRRALIGFVSAVLLLGGFTAVASATAGQWSDAIPVPGIQTLTGGDDSSLRAISCPTDGNCSAGGSYVGVNGDDQAFVISQVSGVWGPASAIPGLEILNIGNDARLVSISCASAGNCSAGGVYRDSPNSSQAFLVSQVDGVWAPAIAVPGLEILRTGDEAGLESISCASAGNCTAGGNFNDTNDLFESYVVSQVDGVWGTAALVPGLAALNIGGYDDINQISCTGNGYCTVGGQYVDGNGDDQAFVASQVAGVWATAALVPGLEQLNVGDEATILSVSCASPGNCSAAGRFNTLNHQQGFAATQVGGVWGPAAAIPGLVELSGDRSSRVESISCTSPGNCVAGGTYVDDDDRYQGFVASQEGGVWGSATDVPGLTELNTLGDASVDIVSCTSPGNCTAGGIYGGDGWSYQSFVVAQIDGVWDTAIPLPGLAALTTGNGASIRALDCSSDGNCSAGGSFRDADDFSIAFVADISTPHPSPTPVPDLPIVPAFTG